MRFLPATFLLLLIPSSIWADTAPTPPKTFDLKEIDAYLTKQVANGHVGLSVAFVRDGKVIHAKGYGKASMKPDVALDAKIPLAAGSVTKQFTCACIFLLAEDGKLSVRDAVSKYYPDLTKAKEITLYDLMTHVSGYPDYYPLDFVDRRMKKPIPLDDLLKEYAGSKLDFPPHSRWSYSNTGYILLGRVIEKVSGKSFGEFLSERILKPLEMNDSLVEPKLDRKGIATGYTSFALGDPEPAVREADGWIHAAGGLYTTPSDLAKWNLALIGGKVLKPESFRLMTEPRELSDGRIRDYGCGLGVGRRRGEPSLSHSGAVSGFLAFNHILPRTKSAVILMSNADHLDVGDIHGTLLNLFLTTQTPAPDVPKIAGLPAKAAATDLFKQLQKGEIKRDELGEEYSLFLTEERVKGAKERLGKLGEPTTIVADPSGERGGMEVTTVHFTFKTVKLKGSMYRTPDGKVQQFLLYQS